VVVTAPGWVITGKATAMAMIEVGGGIDKESF
jgi:hypothetical protein